MDASIWMWVGFNVFVVALLAFDLGLLNRRPKVIGVREAMTLSAFYVVLALIFAAGLFHFADTETGLAFLTGYLVEKSLSLDNVFVIALIFGSFAVPPQFQHRVLFWGVLGALVMRGVMIAAGAMLVKEYQWVLYIFGAFLVATGVKMLWLSDAPERDPADHPLVAFLRRRLRMTEGFEGQRFFVRRNGLLYATPLFLVLVLVEFTDLIFAIDSIPAIFAITTDPFIVYTSNVFAILGLRALYFALAEVIRRFHYLKIGLALVLVVIGTKMLLLDVWKMPTALALAITALLVFGSMLLSVLRPRSPAHVKG